MIFLFLSLFLRFSSGLSLPLPSLSSHPLSSSVSSTSASVPKENVLLGVKSSALEGGSDGSSSYGVFSVAPVPEVSFNVSDLLTFTVSDAPTLKSCSQSQDFFKQVVRFISLLWR